MTEVVSSIQRVTTIMGEISVASREQASGVSQVGEAVTQMDQTTQQNAALVEQMAAAATGLKGQAQDLVQVVAVFKLGEDAQYGLPKSMHRSGTAPKAQGPKTQTKSAPVRSVARAPAAKIALPPSAPAKTSAKATPAGGDDDWETF